MRRTRPPVTEPLDYDQRLALIKLKGNGGLTYPSSDVTATCILVQLLTTKLFTFMIEA